MDTKIIPYENDNASLMYNYLLHQELEIWKPVKTQARYDALVELLIEGSINIVFRNLPFHEFTTEYKLVDNSLLSFKKEIYNYGIYK